MFIVIAELQFRSPIYFQPSGSSSKDVHHSYYIHCYQNFSGFMWYHEWTYGLHWNDI